MREKRGPIVIDQLPPEVFIEMQLFLAKTESEFAKYAESHPDMSVEETVIVKKQIRDYLAKNRSEYMPVPIRLSSNPFLMYAKRQQCTATIVMIPEDNLESKHANTIKPNN